MPPETPSHSSPIGPNERREIAMAASFVMMHSASASEMRSSQPRCGEQIENNRGALMLSNKGSLEDSIVSSCNKSMTDKSL